MRMYCSPRRIIQGEKLPWLLNWGLKGTGSYARVSMRWRKHAATWSASFRNVWMVNKLQHGIRLVEHRTDLAFPDGLTPKDRPIFQAALACLATQLLTGDLKD